MPTGARKVLLIGWDSADWRVLRPLLERGAMPVLAGLLERGCWGNLASIEPMLSPVVWTSIATGQRPHKHGVLGFVEPCADGSGVSPVGSGTRQVPALWNLLSAAGLRTHVIGWFASHPAEKISGVCVSEQFPLPTSPSPEGWPVAAGSVSPPQAAEWLAELRVHPTEIDGEALQPFVPRAAELDQADPVVLSRLRHLAAILAKAASLQAAATAVLAREPWDFLSVYFQALDELGHHFMPFHPPTLEGVDPQEAAMWGRVMEMACAFHDRMLGHLLELAGPEATVIVVSDHGFESGESRPGPVANDHATMAGWHRRYGMLAMAGPGVIAGEQLYGSSVLDVAPTILHLFGLPVSTAMDGKVLLSALADPAAVTRCDEKLLAPTTEATARDAAAETAALEQLIALGYVEEMPAEMAAAREVARRELVYNRISSLADAGLAADAVPFARELAADCPQERRFRLKLVQTLLLARQPAEAAEEVTKLTSELGRCASSQRLEAHAWLELGRVHEAMERFTAAEHLGGPHATLHEQIGAALLRLRRWAEAEARFREALRLEPDRPHSFVGLARALVRQDRDAEALEAALEAVGLLHFLPLGHFQLGAILSKMGMPEKALQAFETGLSMQPGNAHALRYTSLLRRRLAAPRRVEATWPIH